MSLKTFSRGGIHPSENKLSSGKGIEVLEPPESVIIPVSQHLGAPSKVMVERGDEVKVGQLIASSEGFVSTNIHSSVSGKVTKVDKFMDSTGYRKTAVQIQVEGDQWLDTIDRSDDLVRNTVLSSEDIRKNAGCRDCWIGWGHLSKPCETHGAWWKNCQFSGD